MTRCVLLLPAVLILAPGCLGSATPPPKATEVQYADANKSLGIDVDAARTEAPEASVSEEVEVVGLAFGKVSIRPAKPTVASTLVAEIEVKQSPGYADYDIRWFVNDSERLGMRGKELDARQGHFKRGDAVRFSVSGLGPTGVIIEAASQAVLIENAIPTITTDATNKRGIDGLLLKAEDADGDKIAWSVQEGPPGVSIDPTGRVHVAQVDLDKDFDGEVVIAATDTVGAKAEYHVPVKINAARQEKVGERQVTVVRTRDNMDSKEYADANLKNLDKIEGMSAEEFERYTKEQEAAEDKRREAEKK